MVLGLDDAVCGAALARDVTREENVRICSKFVQPLAESTKDAVGNSACVLARSTIRIALNSRAFMETHLRYLRRALDGDLQVDDLSLVVLHFDSVDGLTGGEIGLTSVADLAHQCQTQQSSICGREALRSRASVSTPIEL